MKLPVVMADAGQLHQVFLNLILNAAEAMPGGGQLIIRSRVESRSDKSPERAMIRIDFKDNGPGMSKDLQQRAFSGVLSSTKAKGSGLGLAIVGRIVEAHHGSVQIRSRPGRGTTITVRLPVAMVS
jgi:signal transduction histidine kinase